jgi:tripartite-type tricarboxylate transporter receptor subunit TctC
MHTTKLSSLTKLVSVALLTASGQAFAADDADAQAAARYPDKPIRIIAPSSAGGGIDTLSRIIGAEITKTWGESIVVDNRPGAGGIIGSNVVAQAKPDGYTILLVASGYTINPSLYKTLPYDTIKDFERVSYLACAPNMLVVNPSVPVKTVEELVAYAKANPDGLTYGSSGVGTTSYLSGLLFTQAAGIKMVQVPYKGAGQSNMAALAGEVDSIFSAPHEMIPHAREGRMTALGVTSDKRLPLMPDVPTIAESGFPGFDVQTCYGVLAPAGTPKPIIDKLSAKLVEVINTPAVRNQLEELSFSIIGSTPEEYTAIAKADMARWIKVLKEAGVQPQ